MVWIMHESILIIVYSSLYSCVGDMVATPVERIFAPLELIDVEEMKEDLEQDICPASLVTSYYPSSFYLMLTYIFTS